MPRSQFLRVVPSFVLVLAVVLGSPLFAASADQQSNSSTVDQNKNEQATDNSGDPLKRPINEKRKKENARSLKRELRGEYKKWLDEDVRWIITDD